MTTTDDFSVVRVRTRILAVRAVLVAAVITVAFVPGAFADDGPAAVVASGAKRFERHCALCHGKDAKGFGLYLSTLKTKPSNLTLLAKKNDGCFPFAELYRIIEGRDMSSSHGTREMPIWGEEFKAMVPGESETLVQGRILEILMFLDSIQER
ncbi:MAG: hypothetical protein IT495_09090 [Gammaproteobacteria bacterium]|nr:hypothetical protein [Gammaproteobacteria bacterium]